MAEITDRTTGAAAVQPVPLGLAHPNIAIAERRRVAAALDGPQIVGGEPVRRFEQAVGRHCGERTAVATSSGTAALHLALLAAGVGHGDAVLMPALTFVAPANAVRYTGAFPLMLDVEPRYRQLDLELVDRWLRDCCDERGEGVFTRGDRSLRVAAVMPVDLLGHPVDVEALEALLARYEQPPVLVEDAAEALGAAVRGRPVGSVAETACLSFNANKTVTAAGGGAVLCDGEDVASRVRRLANQAREGTGWRHSEVGFNYKLANMNAALGLAQLERLGDFVAVKRANAGRYRAGLDDLPGVRLPGEAPWAHSTYWLYAIEIDPPTFGLDAERLADELAAEGIESRPMFTALHLTDAHAGSAAAPCPVAERIGATGLALPSSTTLGEEDVDRVAAAIRAAHRRAR